MNEVQTAAAAYIQRGWRVVPLPPTKEGKPAKAATAPNWQQLVFKDTDFRPSDNVGILLTAGLVDVDADAAEVVLVAPAFLPPTACTYGRPAKPGAHRFYACPSLTKPVKYEDLVTKTCLIEVRTGGGQQSMAPPSTHPDGQVLAWEDGGPGDPAPVEEKALVRAVQLTALAALTARHYNSAGQRHDWGVALAGVFRQLGLSAEEATAVFAAAAAVAGDDKVDDRLLAVRSTFSKSDDDPLKGANALTGIMGNAADFLASLRKICGADTAGVPRTMMDTLNAKHAVIFQQSGDLVIITEDMDSQGRPFVRYSTSGTIRDLYPQKVVVGFTTRGQPKTQALGAAWLEHPKRRFYEGIELAPNGRANPTYYNLWRGFSVQPVPGAWPRLKDHIFNVICNRVPDIFDYVLGWMAQAVQDPGHQAETAIAMRGGEGTGKGFFVREFGSLFGVHFLHLDSSRHLTGNFNAHLQNAILVFADEAAWPGDKAGQGALKRLVTEPTLSIERKGFDIFTVPNVIHMLMASNEGWIAPVGADARRFVVLDVNNSRANDHPYFEKIADELKQGGYEGMLHELLNMKVTVNLRAIPATIALWENKLLSMDPQQRWWYQVLKDRSEWWNFERSPGDYGLDRDAVYTDYVEVLHRAGQGRISIGTELGMLLRKMMPEGFPRDWRRGGDGKRFWMVPSLKECRAFFDKQYKLTTESNWPIEEQYEVEDRLPPF